MTQSLDPQRVAMLGTDRVEPRCIALRGEIGAQVECAIYTKRPSPCRDLQASFENGSADDQCERARRRYGLTPLSLMDWAIYRRSVAKTGVDPVELA